MTSQFGLLKKSVLTLLGCTIGGATVYALTLPYERVASPRLARLLSSLDGQEAPTPLSQSAPVRRWGRLEIIEGPAAWPEPPALPAPEGSSESARARRARTARVPRAAATPTRAAEEPAPLAARGLPAREEVSAVMKGLRQQVQQCYDVGMVPGRVMLTLVIGGRTGKALEAKVSARTSTAACIKRLAEGLRFPRFAEERLVVHYPYTFR